MLRVELEGVISAINLPRPLDGSTWRVTLQGVEVALGALTGYDGAFVSISQEADGQHNFVSLDDAVAGVRSLRVFSEAEAKKQAKKLLYARAPSLIAQPTIVSSNWDFPELAPHGRMSNYAVVSWCCRGKTRALILTDEATLCRDLPSEKILKQITLVINCHENKNDCDTRKYKCGENPAVIAHAVHRWGINGAREAVAKNDEIQKAIWDHLENRGSVAVHCLAGIHRAACITVCHFLYRYHVLGHRDVPCDTEDIYRKLQSIRPAVSPAYLDILRTYEQHCKNQARNLQ